MNFLAAARPPAGASSAFWVSSRAVASEACVSFLVSASASESLPSSPSRAAILARRVSCCCRNAYVTVSGALGTSGRYTKSTTVGTDTAPPAVPGPAAVCRAQASVGVSPGRTTRRPSPASRKARSPRVPDRRMTSSMAAASGVSARSRSRIAPACSFGTSEWLAQATTSTARLTSEMPERSARRASSWGIVTSSVGTASSNSITTSHGGLGWETVVASQNHVCSPLRCSHRSLRRSSPPNHSRRVEDDPPLLGLGGSVAGARTPARGRVAYSRDGLSERPPESLEQRLLQRPAGKERGGVSPAAAPGRLARRGVHRARGLPALSQPDARDPRAPLAHRAVPPSLADRPRLLPDAAGGRRGRQSRSADRGRRAAPDLPHPRALHRGPARDRDPGDVRGHPLGPLRAAGGADRWAHPHPARLHGLGLDPVRGGGHVADRLDRPPAGPAELRSAALRGRLPVQPGALPGEHGGRGALSRRAGRVPRVPRALRGGGAQLVGHHAAAEADHHIHLRLLAGRGDRPVRRGGPALLPGRARPGGPDADGRGLQPGPGRAQLLRRVVQGERGLVRGGRAARRLRARARTDAPRRRAGRRRPPRRPAPHAPDRRGRGPPPPRRPAPRDPRESLAAPRGQRAPGRRLGIGQEHALPGDRRNLALRARRDPRVAPGPRPLSPPATVPADRHPPQRGELPDARRRGGRRHAARGPRGGGSGWPGRPPGRGRPLGAPALPRRAAAHRVRPRPGPEAGLGLSWRGDSGGW